MYTYICVAMCMYVYICNSICIVRSRLILRPAWSHVSYTPDPSSSLPGHYMDATLLLLPPLLLYTAVAARHHYAQLLLLCCCGHGCHAGEFHSSTICYDCTSDCAFICTFGPLSPRCQMDVDDVWMLSNVAGA